VADRKRRTRWLYECGISGRSGFSLGVEAATADVQKERRSPAPHSRPVRLCRWAFPDAGVPRLTGAFFDFRFAGKFSAEG
jgi:hypothetical protein